MAVDTDLDELLTMKEAAQLLRISRHTVQAWLAPSSPIHRPEFARLARRAGRKILLRRGDLLAWLDQRHPIGDPLHGTEISAYWFERFVGGRGLLRGYLRSNPGPSRPTLTGYRGGALGFGPGPLTAWLVDAPEAPRILNVVQRADSLILPLGLASRILSRLRTVPRVQADALEFFFEQAIFVPAPMTEEVVRRALTYPEEVSETQALYLSAVLVQGATAFATWEENLRSVPGVPVFIP